MASGSEKTTARISALDRSRETAGEAYNKSCTRNEVSSGSQAESLTAVAQDLDALHDHILDNFARLTATMTQLDALAARLSEIDHRQIEFVGRLTALEARIEILEARLTTRLTSHTAPYEGDTMTHENASPAPADLVERMAEELATEIGEAVYRLSHRGGDYGWPGVIAIREKVEPILRSRFARALEVAK